MLNMSVAADDGEVVTVRCEGDINQIYFQIGNPLEKILGCLTFTRKVILNLEKVNFLDSSDLEVSNDSYKEFANADYKDYRDMARGLPARSGDTMNVPHVPRRLVGLNGERLEN